MLTVQQRNEAQQRVLDFVTIGNAVLNTDLRNPNVRFDKRGTCGGTANTTDNELNFNAGLMVDNWEEYMEQVIPHEVAHLLKNRIYGHGRGNGANSSHGFNWKQVMRALGVSPDRTHQMDTTKVAIHKAKHVYVCEGCKKELVVGSIRHNRMQREGRKYSHCRGTALTHKVALGKVSYSDAVQRKAEAPKQEARRNPPKAPAMPKAGTKISKILAIYNRYAGASRQDMITYIVGDMALMHNETMTRNQAAGYYQNCKKKVG